jgi:hypothetical protein
MKGRCCRTLFVRAMLVLTGITVGAWALLLDAGQLSAQRAELLARTLIVRLGVRAR